METFLDSPLLRALCDQGAS